MCRICVPDKVVCFHASPHEISAFEISGCKQATFFISEHKSDDVNKINRSGGFSKKVSNKKCTSWSIQENIVI